MSFKFQYFLDEKDRKTKMQRKSEAEDRWESEEVGYKNRGEVKIGGFKGDTKLPNTMKSKLNPGQRKIKPKFTKIMVIVFGIGNFALAILALILYPHQKHFNILAYLFILYMALKWVILIALSLILFFFFAACLRIRGKTHIFKYYIRILPIILMVLYSIVIVSSFPLGGFILKHRTNLPLLYQYCILSELILNFFICSYYIYIFFFSLLRKPPDFIEETEGGDNRISEEYIRSIENEIMSAEKENPFTQLKSLAQLNTNSQSNTPSQERTMERIGERQRQIQNQIEKAANKKETKSASPKKTTSIWGIKGSRNSELKENKRKLNRSASLATSGRDSFSSHSGRGQSESPSFDQNRMNVFEKEQSNSYTKSKLQSSHTLGQNTQLTRFKNLNFEINKLELQLSSRSSQTPSPIVDNTQFFTPKESGYKESKYSSPRIVKDSKRKSGSKSTSEDNLKHYGFVVSPSKTSITSVSTFAGKVQHAKQVKQGKQVKQVKEGKHGHLGIIVDKNRVDELMQYNHETIEEEEEKAEEERETDLDLRHHYTASSNSYQPTLSDFNHPHTNNPTWNTQQTSKDPTTSPRLRNKN